MGCKLNRQEISESTNFNRESRQINDINLAGHTTINTVNTISTRGPTEYNMEFGQSLLSNFEQPRIQLFYQPKENVWAENNSEEI